MQRDWGGDVAARGVGLYEARPQPELTGGDERLAEKRASAMCRVGRNHVYGVRSRETRRRNIRTWSGFELLIGGRCKKHVGRRR